MRLILYHIILVIVTDLSVNGHPQSNREEQNYEYYYYDDEYYYADDLTGNIGKDSLPLKRQLQTNTNTPAPSDDGDSLSEAKEAIAQYDIDELVKAWREYMEEKEKKELQKTKNTGVANNHQRNPTGGRRRPGNQHRLRGQGISSGLSADGDQRIHTGPRRRRPSRPRPVRPRTTTTTTTLPLLPAEDLFYYDYYDYQYECPPRDQSYSTPDPVQCDKYYECNIKGEETGKLCPDGYVFDINAQHCDYPSKVNCTGRPKLQEPQPSKNCPRANGFFAWPAEESCQKFWDCRGGKFYLQTCAAGVIFDPKIDACTTPDQSARSECAAGKFLGFECPTYDSEEVLRFGNHDRLANPQDCQQFFSCLRTGQPRLGACPKKTVFNEATGHCDDPNNVKGCETYWKDKEKEEFDDYYDY